MGKSEEGVIPHGVGGAADELVELGERNLAPVGEVLRARVRESYGAELVVLLRAGVSEDRAERLAAEHRSEVASGLTRRFAGDVLAGRLAVYLPDLDARLCVGLARRVRAGEGWDNLLKGARLKLFELAAIPSIDHPLSPTILSPTIHKPSFARVSENSHEFEEVFVWLAACCVGESWAVRDLLQSTPPGDAFGSGVPGLNGKRAGSPKAAVLVRREVVQPTKSIDWGAALHIRADWPSEEPAARPAWPWGEYTTPDLELLAEAVRVHWTGWDGETASAPKNDNVIAWLEARGMSNNRAQAVAALIRSPKVPSGARPRRDE